MDKCYVGITRFSLVSENSKAWLISQQKSYLENLFSPTRLNDRIMLFSKSLAALNGAVKESPYAVYHFVFYSDILPDLYKSQLLNICEEYNFVYPIKINSKKNQSLTENIENFLLSEGIEEKVLIGMYGLDDDDFLSQDYFSYSSKYLKLEYCGFRVSYGSGMIGLYDKGRFFNIRESYFPKVNIGILTIGKIVLGKIQLPPGGSHMLIDKAAPLILDSTKCMYFWTRHKGQDTNTRRNDEFGINVFNLDSLPLVDSNKLQKKFPIIHENIINEKHLLTVSNIDKAISIICGGKLKFLFEVKILESGKQRPLISLIFKDKAGNVLSDLDCKKIGIVLSANKDIGYYRYISSDSRVDNEIILNLPISVHSITLSVFSRDNQLIVNNLRIYQLEL